MARLNSILLVEEHEEMRAALRDWLLVSPAARPAQLLARREAP